MARTTTPDRSCEKCGEGPDRSRKRRERCFGCGKMVCTSCRVAGRAECFECEAPATIAAGLKPSHASPLRRAVEVEATDDPFLRVPRGAKLYARTLGKRGCVVACPLDGWASITATPLGRAVAEVLERSS
jgi:hypothetical protein